MIQKKRGAIELSMTTIIIVIIGITLLTLGLRWVYNIFGDIERQRTQITEAMEQQIREMFGASDDPLNLLTNAIQIEQGKSYDLGIAIKNVEANSHNYRYAIKAGSASGDLPTGISAANAEKWFLYTRDSIQLDSGEFFPDTINIDIPKGSQAPIGRYRFYIMLYEDSGSTPKTQQPLTIRVV